MFYLSNHNRGTGVAHSWLRAPICIACCACIVALSSGCLAKKKSRLSELLAPHGDSVAEGSSSSSPGAAKDAATDNSLAAIEEFLQRTSQYRATGSDSAMGIPASPVLFPKEGDKVMPAPIEERGATTPVESVTTNAQITIEDAHERRPAIPIPAVVAVSIGSSKTVETRPVEQQATKATNLAMDVRANPMRPTFDDLLADLAKQVEEKKDFDAQWRLRLGQLAAGRDEDAMAIVKKLPEDQARLLTDLIDAAMAVRDAARDPLLNGETALATVDDLRDTLADRADPSVESIAFCRKVSTFGVYEKMSREDFVAGRKIQTIVYSEIRNLRAQRTTDDRFETRLSTRMAVYSDNGNIVWERDEPEIVDSCSQRRTDFFIAQRISLPATLPTGPYVLKVLVEDKLGGRASESMHEFEIFAPVSVAQGQ